MLELVSVHVPKAAGTSLRRVLEQWYGRDLFSWYPAWPEARFGQPVVPVGTAVHGHFRAADAPKGRVTVTFVREPLARLVSQYAYWLDEAPLGHPEHERLVREQTSFDEFALRMRNQQTLYVGDLDQYDFVGLTETFADDVTVLARMLDKPTPHIPHEMRGDTKEAWDSLDWLDDVDAIREAHADDFALYEAALGRRVAA